MTDKPPREPPILSEEMPGAVPGAYGRVPPCDLDAEAVVLSAMMLDEVALDEALDVVTADDFYSDANRLICTAIQDIHSRGEPVDVVVVASWLRARDQIQRVDVSYLGRIVDATPAVANVRAHAQIVRNLKRVRLWIVAAQKWAAAGYTSDALRDPDAYIQQAAADFQQLLEDTGGGDFQPFKHILGAVITKSRQLQNDEQQLAGVSTGSDKLDERTGGHHGGDMTTVAARPGMGKTSLMINFIREATKPEHIERPPMGDVYVWSGEMPKEQVAARIIAQEAEVDLRRLRQGRLTDVEWGKVMSAANVLAERHIWIDDEPGITPLQFRTRARRVALRAQQYGRKLVLCAADYLQLMGGSGKTREQEVASVSLGMKHTAKALMVPVIALSQLNRSVEQRQDKTPMLADLRESGSIEQDSDNIFFLYRPGYYVEQRGKPDDTEGRTQLTIAKQRNGPTGSILLRWFGGCAKFGRWNY